MIHKIQSITTDVKHSPCIAYYIAVSVLHFADNDSVQGYNK